MAKKIKFRRVKVKEQSIKMLVLITGMTFLIAMLFSCNMRGLSSRQWLEPGPPALGV